MLAAGVLLAAVVSIYALGNKRVQQKPSQFQQEINSIQQVSEDDSLDSIEKDLQETQMEGIDEDLNQIEDEFESAYQ